MVDAGSPDKSPEKAEPDAAPDREGARPAAADRATEAPGVGAPATPPRRPIELIEEAKRQLKELTGYPVDSVSEFGRVEDGWKLTIAVVELSRIPPATDVLAEYIVGLDRAGDIVDYRRGRRYFRDQVGEPT